MNNLILNQSYRLSHFNKKIRIIIFIMLIMGLFACSSNGIKGVAEAPSISVKSVKINRMSLMGGEATIIINMSNPNRFPLPLKGFEYGLKLNGIEVAKGSKQGELSVDGRGNRLLYIPVQLSLLELIRFAPQLLTRKGLTYELDGLAHFPMITVPFRRVGSTEKSS